VTQKGSRLDVGRKTFNPIQGAGQWHVCWLALRRRLNSSSLDESWGELTEFTREVGDDFVAAWTSFDGNRIASNFR
jgi:hypothetical protein